MKPVEIAMACVGGVAAFVLLAFIFRKSCRLLTNYWSEAESRRRDRSYEYSKNVGTRNQALEAQMDRETGKQAYTQAHPEAVPYVPFPKSIPVGKTEVRSQDRVSGICEEDEFAPVKSPDAIQARYVSNLWKSSSKSKVDRSEQSDPTGSRTPEIVD